MVTKSLVTKQQIIFLFCLVFAFCWLSNCTQRNFATSEHILDIHEIMDTQINNYLQSKHISEVGFDGEVYCVHELLGGDDNQLSILCYCQEYYPMADSIKEGTGMIRPVKITVRGNRTLLDDLLRGRHIDIP